MAVDRDENGRVSRARFAFGGVAATPLRVIEAEEAILGQPWNEAAVERIQRIFDRTLAADQRSPGVWRIPSRDIEAVGGEVTSGSCVNDDRR